MGKFYAFPGVLAIGVVAVLALLTALASASASLANGTANLVSSTALLTGPCMTGFLMPVSLAVGVTFGLGWSALRSKALPQPPVAQPCWVSGPNARWGRISAQPVQPKLPAPQMQPVERPVHLVAEAEETEDELPLNGGGF